MGLKDDIRDFQTRAAELVQAGYKPVPLGVGFEVLDEESGRSASLVSVLFIRNGD